MRASIGSAGQLEDERRGDGPIRKSRDKTAEGPPSFKERQDILNHEIAGQVHDGTDDHQRERKSHP